MGAQNPTFFDSEAVTEVQAISDSLGFQVAVILCEAYGGRTLYVPCKPSPTHPIAVDVGFEKLREMCDIFGGQTIHLPALDCRRLVQQKRSAIRMSKFGMRPRDIAPVLQVCEDTVRKWLAEHQKREGTQ